MPIIKSISQGGNTSVYHSVGYVEYYHKSEGLSWRGKFQSFSSAGPVTPPLHTGVELGIPVSAPGPDPVRAFEEACIATPSSIFYGGEYVEPGQSSTSLSLEKTVAWQRVKGARDAYLNAGVDTPFGRFDSDLNTLVNLLGAVAEMPEGGSQGWILADHTPVILTKPQLRALGAALKTLRDSSYAQGSALYAQIQAAQTAEAVRAISWTPPA